MPKQGNNSDHKIFFIYKKTNATFRKKKLTKYSLLDLNLNIISFYFFIDFVKNWFPIFHVFISK